MTTFGIRPTVSTILFEINFDLYQLFNLFNVDRESRRKIDFLNFKGFNQQQQEKSNLFVKKFLKAYTIDIKDTKFRFYLDNKQIEASMCVSENFNQSYFGPIKDMFFSADVIYEQNICPYIFLNTQLNFLSLSGITNSLLFKNRLSFLTLNQNQTKTKTSLIVLTLVIVYERLDLNLLNLNAFKSIKVLQVSGIIYKIDRDLFKEFDSLKVFVLSPADLGKFFHQDNLDWSLSLNSKMKRINLTNSFEINTFRSRSAIVQIYEKSGFFSQSYLYPNEDFCVFKDFPHEKLIYPSIIFAENELQCSCTIFWLIQYSSLYMNVNFTHYNTYIYSNYPDEFNTSSARNCLYNFDLKHEIKKCDFN